MRRSSIPISIALAALALAGCGGDGGDDGSTLARELDALCVEARADVEALGLPAERGIGVVAPWAKRGKQLARAVAKVDTTSPQEAEQVATLSKYLSEYYAGLSLAYLIYRNTKSAENYAVAVDRADPFLTSAETLATELGATECAVRPFADYQPS
ncbi:MAG: hypothetical protein ACRC50_07555 [Gaiella sp.]